NRNKKERSTETAQRNTSMKKMIHLGVVRNLFSKVVVFIQRISPPPSPLSKPIIPFRKKRVKILALIYSELHKSLSPCKSRNNTIGRLALKPPKANKIILIFIY